MYIGRIVCVSMTADRRLCASYRVSSRSFPNRTAVLGENKVSIVPKEGHEADIMKNPYIAYNCVRLVCGGDVAVVTNGSHTDPIAEKIESGMSPRDSLTLNSLALDYEKDDYNTPRVSAVVDRRDRSGWLSVVREDGIEVRRMPLEPGYYCYIATYEENKISTELAGEYDADSAESACDFVLGKSLFAYRTNPIAAVAAMANGSGFDLAVKDAEPD